MPFGLKNAALMFQQLMDSLFHSLPVMFIYLGNILVSSNNRSAHLKQVFQVLANNGLRITLPNVSLLSLRLIALATMSIWSRLSSFLGISPIQTTAFRLHSNGLVEGFHRRLKSTLRAQCTSPYWYSQLPWFLLSYRSSPHDLSNLSPAEAVFGTPLMLPAQFLSFS